MNYLAPLSNIDDLLNQQQQRHKDKAEKTAKNLITSSVKASTRENKKKEKKGNRKGKGKGGGAQQESDAENENQDPEAIEAARAQKAAEILAKAERDQAKLDGVLNEHLERFKLPDHVPLTKLSSVDERMVKSSRGVLMQQALSEAEAYLGKQTASSSCIPTPVRLGLAAALQIMDGKGNRKGSGKSKSAGKKSKDNVEDHFTLFVRDVRIFIG